MEDTNTNIFLLEEEAFGMDHGEPTWPDGDLFFCSDEHTTLLALWVLLEQRYPEVSAPLLPASTLHRIGARGDGADATK